MLTVKGNKCENYFALLLMLNLFFAQCATIALVLNIATRENHSRKMLLEQILNVFNNKLRLSKSRF